MVSARFFSNLAIVRSILASSFSWCFLISAVASLCPLASASQRALYSMALLCPSWAEIWKKRVRMLTSVREMREKSFLHVPSWVSRIPKAGCGPRLGADGTLTISEPPPLNGDDQRDPSIKALKRRWFIKHGST